MHALFCSKTYILGKSLLFQCQASAFQFYCCHVLVMLGTQRFVNDFMLMQVVASQDWPEVTKYAGLVSAQTRRQELIQDLFKVWQDPQKGTVNGGMVRYDLVHL